MINLSAANSSQLHPLAIQVSPKKPVNAAGQSFGGALSQAIAPHTTAAAPKLSAILLPQKPLVQSQKIVARQTPASTALHETDTVVLSSSASSKTTANVTPAQQPALTGFAALAAVYGSPTITTAASTPPPAQPADTEDFDDAYWAQQPPAVQQLRNISDPDQRTALATQLASEGYSIDVPIMDWGWDPAKVTQLRQSFGYTWVPSAEQANVTAAPGITGPGIIPYDPNNPPAGSIAVPAAS